MSIRRKKRDLSELQSNPHFQFYVGRLVGAAETTANWLQLQDDPQTKQMGHSLAAVTGWFLLDDYEPAEEAITQILPPKP